MLKTNHDAKLAIRPIEGKLDFDLVLNFSVPPREAFEI